MAGESLGDRIVEQATHIDAAMQRLLADIRAFDASEVWASEGMQSCAHWLSWRVGWGLAMARDRVRVARGLGEFPATDACLGSGELSYSQVRAVLRVATPENEAMLLEIARLSTAEQLEQVARKYASVQAHEHGASPRDDHERRHVRRRVMDDGMIRIEATLHPEEAEMVWAMLDHAAKQGKREAGTGGLVTAVTADAANRKAGEAGELGAGGSVPAVTAEPESGFSRADGLMRITQKYLRGEQVNRSPMEVMVTVPVGAMHGDEIGCVGESGIDREAARRLSCDAGVVEVKEDGEGVPVAVGRKRRTISGAIKRALLKRYTVCTFPGCTNHVFLEGHHIRHWADGGETKMENLVMLCTHHHRFVHEYGYAIEMADGRPRFRDRAGKVVTAVTERAVPADLGWPTIRALGTTIRPRSMWDGTRVAYGQVVGHLAFADRR